MLNKTTFSFGNEIKESFEAAAKEFGSNGVVQRIWDKDATVWTNSGEDKWLGWLDIVNREKREQSKYIKFVQEVKETGYEAIVLLGMGGSSLCPEVMSVTFEKTNFFILDSTVPAQIEALTNKLNVANTLFIVASKSGSTLEPNTFLQHFYKLVSDVTGVGAAGSHFVAITDPGSKLEAVAMRDGFRRIFYGEPTVGGRFSALSAFGLIPSAAMGVDVIEFIDSALDMVWACKEHGTENNPGAELGLLLGACVKHGRDKLTIYTSDRLYDVGAWMEQLVAESTGKQGVSIIPVDREEIVKADNYGDDRVFAFLTLGGDKKFESFADELRMHGHPIITVDLTDVSSLGQEFFRWEFATAVVGAEMGINPFDQPDVESAKIEARKITDRYEETGSLPDDVPFAEVGGVKFYGDEAMSGAFVGKQPDSVNSVIDQHLARIVKSDYFALLAYVEMNPETEDLLRKIRFAVQSKHNVATCLGFGPRFLHSTGQAYKGGAANGVFLQITTDDLNDLEVPGQSYTFGVVKAAQSRGDFQVLIDRGRRALRIHLGANVNAGLQMLLNEFEKSGS
jgi:transaldolase/glucose-6-phosphate isomerase